MSHEGKGKSDEVARAIQSITASSAEAKGLVDGVNLSSQEQMRDVGRVTEALAQLEVETRATAASAEESATAAEGLKTQSQILKDIVGRIAAMV